MMKKARVRFVLKMMNSALKMMDFVLIKMNYVSKVMDFVFKTMNVAGASALRGRFAEHWSEFHHTKRWKLHYK